MAISGTTLFYLTSTNMLVSRLPWSHLDACCYIQSARSCWLLRLSAARALTQPRYGIHNYSQRPSLANAFPPPGVSTSSRHCDALDDKVENLLRDKKTLINLSYPMDWSIHVGSAATPHVPYDYCSLSNKRAI